ncbi:MAG TPA: hypothetical protein VK524_34595 [Polyangiaceae bacterium]|nr:hypothetical protein [Polyangiaceae bacterium]
MPAPTAPLLGFVLGIAFAWAAADELQRSAGSGGTSRSLVLVTLFSLLCFAPVAAYFLAFVPDWSYAYLVDPERVPNAVDLALALLDAASVPLGFAMAARSASARRLGSMLRLAAVPGLLALAFLMVCLQRLNVHATYAQYHGDFGTRSVAGSPLGYALLWMAAVLGAAIAWTIYCLRALTSGTRRS